MYSRLDPIFKTAFRQTEATDTRLGIRQDDGRENHKKDHKRDGEDEGGFGPDSMEVSVAALMAFLESLASSGSGESASLETPDTKSEMENAQVTPASHAASAYQETARRTGGESVNTIAVPASPPASGIKLTEEELKTISQLLSGLKNLEKKGVSSIVIPQGDSLLQSLKRQITES